MRLGVGDVEADALQPVGAGLGQRVDDRAERVDGADPHGDDVARLVGDDGRRRLGVLAEGLEDRVEAELAGLHVAALDPGRLERREDRGHRLGVGRERRGGGLGAGVDAGGDGGEVGHRVGLGGAGDGDLPRRPPAPSAAPARREQAG